MKTHKCILCGSKNSTLIQKIDISDIQKLYRAKFNYDINKLKPPNFIYYYHCNNCDLEYFLPAFIADAEFYRYFEKYPWYYMKTKPEFAIASKYIKNNDSVLEIGSGEGGFVNYIRSKKYTGLELNDRAVKIAQKNHINIKNESLDEHMKNIQKKYDVVCLFQLLEHVDRVGIFLNKTIRLLKKGGYLIISVPSNGSLMGKAVNATLNLPPHHQTRWTDKCLRFVSKRFGLKVTKIYHEPLAGYHSSTYLREKALNLLGINKRIAVEPSILFKIVSLSLQMATYLPSKFISKGKLIGQSVTVIYKKL